MKDLKCWNGKKLNWRAQNENTKAIYIKKHITRWMEELDMRRTFQEIMQAEDYEALIKKFAAVKSKLNKNYYQRKFIDDVERFILEQSNYVEED